MHRILASFSLLALLATAAPAAGAQEKAAIPKDGDMFDGQPVLLNDRIVIEENIIRLGDLFTNAGTQAEAAIAYAPEPGKQAVLDARWLYRVARAYGLDWKPMGATVHSIVERASIVVGRDEIKAQVMDALADQNIGPDMDVEFSSNLRQIHLPAGADPTIRIDEINYNPRTGRFTAIVGATLGARSHKRLRLTGRAFRTVDVPVLTRRVLRGEIIREGDLRWVRWFRMSCSNIQ